MSEGGDTAFVKIGGNNTVVTPSRNNVKEELETLRQQGGMARELQTRLFSPKDGGRLSDEVSFANKEKQRQQEERQKELKAVVPRGSMSAVAKMRAAFDSNPSSPKKTNQKTKKEIVGNEIEKHATDKVLPLDEFHRSLKQKTQKEIVEKTKAADFMHHPDQKSAKEGGDLAQLGAFYKYDGIDHRGFVFVVHELYGMMLLHCTRKRKKGPHFQLPGGHVDDDEFIEAARKYPGQPLKQLLEAAKAGAARELWEETGLDVRADDQISRLRPATLCGGSGSGGNRGNKDGAGNAVSLECMLKNRLYFFLSVNDEDFWNKKKHTDSEIKNLKLVSPQGENGSDLMLKLSEEHSGFKFIKDPKVSADLLKSHSGGVGREALLMAMTAQKGGGEEDKKGKKEGGNSNGIKQPQQQKDRSIDFNATRDDHNPVDLLAKPKRTNGLFSCCSFCI